jgi:mono/diheme cytochrome c family protein
VRGAHVTSLLFVIGILSCTFAAADPKPADALARHGEYVFRIAGCENCHTDRKNKGAPLAGGRRMRTPLGTFVTPNITPDADTGIGRWSERDLQRALREGLSPAGAHYYPAFPYTSYTHLSDEDIRALYAWLRAQPAVSRANEPHELPWYLGFRPLLAAWKWLYFEPGHSEPDAKRTPAWNRGAYLVRAAAHCPECHTPRNALGGFRTGFYLAGTQEGPDDTVVPNITPDRKTGIGRWRKSELIEYLETGMTPDGDYAADVMAEVIDNGLKHLTREDRAAIVEYVRSVPPVENAVKKEKKKENEW